MHLLRNITRYLAFPGVMGIALLATWLLLQHGMHEGLVVIVVIIPILAMVWGLEFFIPYRQDWNKSDQDLKTDVLNLFITQLFIPRLIKPLWIAGLASATLWLNNYSHLISWPHEWPVLAQLFLMLLVAEFGRYWVHRAAHEISWLWRFHAVHHSPNRLYWMNASRFHPLEKVFFLIPEVVPFILFKVSPETTTLYFIFNGVHGIFQHGNIDIRAGWLNYIFSLSELHRWHHSKVIDESNRNYGNNLIIWDMVFGTFYHPKDRKPGTIGLLNPDYPKGYLAQIKAPFLKQRLDKPADYKERPEYYHQQAEQESAAYNRSLREAS